MHSARVAIPILYICWNVFSVNLFSFVLLVDSSNLLCDALRRFVLIKTGGWRRESLRCGEGHSRR
ncbi:hypothetical protein K525DRAFT_194936 [Schizophyllum commune Loenen D]|nr:hypothetical protein K525DRAFT_194936 [Schizophyllum commune Loenen D]